MESTIKKTVVFYTRDAGLTSADAKRMEEAGYLCVKVKDPKHITAPALSSQSWFPVNDHMALLVWKAMCHSSIARDEFGKLIIKAIGSQLSATPTE